MSMWTPAGKLCRSEWDTVGGVSMVNPKPVTPQLAIGLGLGEGLRWGQCGPQVLWSHSWKAGETD